MQRISNRNSFSPFDTFLSIKLYIFMKYNRTGSILLFNVYLLIIIHELK